MTIYSGSKSLDNFRQRTDYEGFTPLTIGSLEAVKFLDVGDKDRLKCKIAVGVPQGSVMFGVTTRPEIGKQGDPCIEVQRHIDDLIQYLPKA